MPLTLSFCLSSHIISLLADTGVAKGERDTFFIVISLKFPVRSLVDEH